MFFTNTVALLLKRGTFPLSRPELADQFRVLGYVHLAELHERLRTDETFAQGRAPRITGPEETPVDLDRTTNSAIGQRSIKLARAREPKSSLKGNRRYGLSNSSSFRTTKRYLGCTQQISSAVNDRIEVDPAP